MKYRSEIDGLRAIAVVPVILFHAGFQIFSGGFVGVDIFFVISGFLITTILIDDIERGEFSILKFYERRARRILPALFFVMLCCLPFAWMWMFAGQMKNFAQSLAAVSLFASNVLFWQESGYFALASEGKPLLHTWSLAIEEQYYVLFPIFLVLAWRFGKDRVFWSIVVLATISLVLSEWGWRNKPSANFYLAPTRAWELFAGSIAAFIVQKKGVQKSEALSLLGLGAIVFSIFVYDRNTPFPSLYTLVPVLGAMFLILFAERGTVAARLLSTKALVSVGLISYSTYLWHQPLFAFARIRSVYEPNDYLMAGMAVLSLILAFFSWKYVEQPFRNGKSTIIKKRSSVFVMSVAGLLFFFATGLWGHTQKGFEWRIDAPTQQIISAKGNRASTKCQDNGSLPFFTKSGGCKHDVSGAIGSVLLLGDSHSTAISSELILILNRNMYSVYNASYRGCVPLVGFRRFDNDENHQCSNFVEKSIAYARANGVDTIVLTARFPIYYWGNRFDNGEGGVEFGDPVILDDERLSGSRWDSEERRNRVLLLFEQRIAELSLEFNVVLVTPIPEMGWDVVYLSAKRAMYHGDYDSEVSSSYETYLARSGVILKLFAKLEGVLDNVKVASIQEALCDSSIGRCIGYRDGKSMYFDDDHLSNEGARVVSPIIVNSIKELHE